MWIVPAFFLIALVYASVGFGGGSSYSALLAYSGIEYALIPLIALLCNIIVVLGGFVRYRKAKLYEWQHVFPLIAISAPFAFIGGLIPLKESTFYIILGCGLLLSSFALLIPVQHLPKIQIPKIILFGLSAVIGLLAGMSGIGGGIFVSPLLHLVQWNDSRKIAAFATLYILVNSITGILGQLTKISGYNIAEFTSPYWSLFIAVLIGGQIGGYLGNRIFSPIIIRHITSILVGYVAYTLLSKGWVMLR